jgi:hypothetical protein
MSKQEQDSFEKENQKYFDEKKYRTLIVGKDGIKNTEELGDVINELMEGKVIPEEREELLNKIKASNPEKVLLKALTTVKDRTKKARLISIYWEIGLDCTADFLFFVKQACEGDYMIAMECLTVIENIENEVPAEQLKEARELLSDKINSNPESAPMLEEILNWVEGRLS